MSHCLGIERDRLIADKCHWTAREIAGQPLLWSEADAQVGRLRERIDEWAGPQLADPGLRIILCGAGSSDFIGRTLAPWLRMKLRRRVEAIATTDLVANPRMHLAEEAPTLMVSFSRSGDSPESVGAIRVTNRMRFKCRHLVLTCNPNGRLARYAADDPDTLRVLLPARSEDRGFAMTGSYTSMLVSCAGVFAPEPRQLSGAIRSSQAVVDNLAAYARKLAGARFERVAVLGAGCLSATSREAALKVLELTNGGVVTISDTPLGIRHGPKCAIDADTCVVLLVSGDAYTARYDLDLLREIESDRRAARIVVLHAGAGGNGSGGNDSRPAHPFTPDALARLGASDRTDIVSVGPDGQANCAGPMDDFWRSLPYLVFCQLFAFFMAREVGVPADNPCPSGEVNRVVQGVSIHPYRG